MFGEAIGQAKTSEDFVEFFCNRADLYYDMGKDGDLEGFAKAANDLDSALNHDPTNSKVHYQQGLTWYAFKKYKKAIKSLKLSLHNGPLKFYEPDIFYHLGLSYCRLQKFEKAIFPFSKCVEKVPSDLRYIHERAKAYQMIEWHKEAVQDFNIVINKNPKNAHAFFRRAFSLKALKVSQPLQLTSLQNYSEAAEDFEQAKNLDPMNPMLVVNYKKLKGVGCIVLCEPGEERIFD